MVAEQGELYKSGSSFFLKKEYEITTKTSWDEVGVDLASVWPENNPSCQVLPVQSAPATLITTNCIVRVESWVGAVWMILIPAPSTTQRVEFTERDSVQNKALGRTLCCCRYCPITVSFYNALLCCICFDTALYLLDGSP